MNQINDDQNVKNAVSALRDAENAMATLNAEKAKLETLLNAKRAQAAQVMAGGGDTSTNQQEIVELESGMATAAVGIESQGGAIAGAQTVLRQAEIAAANAVMIDLKPEIDKALIKACKALQTAQGTLETLYGHQQTAAALRQQYGVKADVYTSQTETAWRNATKAVNVFAHVQPDVLAKGKVIPRNGNLREIVQGGGNGKL